MTDSKHHITDHNIAVWDREAKSGSPWSMPVSSEVIERAKAGDWDIHLTKKPVPEEWLTKDIRGQFILCLASGGGQQAPVLAAAGASVTVVDASIEQLNKDREVARRDELELNTLQADMRDLSELEDNQFDYIIHPIANLYIPDLTPLWEEAYRVLKPQGLLLASFYNPMVFIFARDEALTKQGLLKPQYSLPYNASQLPKKEQEEKMASGQALTFGHTLSEQIGLQIAAGFSLTGFYEDEHPSPRFLIENYCPSLIATCARKTT